MVLLTVAVRGNATAVDRSKGVYSPSLSSSSIGSPNLCFRFQSRHVSHPRQSVPFASFCVDGQAVFRNECSCSSSCACTFTLQRVLLEGTRTLSMRSVLLCESVDRMVDNAAASPRSTTYAPYTKVHSFSFFYVSALTIRSCHARRTYVESRGSSISHTEHHASRSQHAIFLRRGSLRSSAPAPP